MEAKKAKIYKQALEVAEQKKCFFIDQLLAFLPIAKSTFYDYFPVDSNESNSIKAILEKNRVDVKTSMYNKWFKSDNPTLQVALMKLIATDEEAHRLNGTRQQIDHTTKGEKMQTSITVSGATDEDIVKKLLAKFDEEGDE